MTDNIIHTDCRSEVGITVGLIDSLISISRILSGRDMTAPQIREALADLRADEDVAAVIGTEPTPRINELEALNAELVEALNALLNDVGRANSMLGAVKARAALAKAQGETK